MISVIICSANPNDLEFVKASIGETIGVPHEIIAFNNREGRKGICQVYNEGTRLARFKYLCFMHEDIECQTMGWGQSVLDLFHSDDNIGLIGVAGGGYKSITPSGWFNYEIEQNGGAYSNVIQGFKRRNKADRLDYNNPKYQRYSQVACIDGCWMCTRKSIAEEYPFDEKLLKRFHGYDLDFSLSVNQKHKVVVTFEVLLRHFSEGNYDVQWFDEMLKIHQKWSHALPLDADQLISGDLLMIEKRAFRLFLQKSLDAGIPYSTLLRAVWNARPSRLIGTNMALKLAFALLKMKPGKYSKRNLSNEV